MAVGQRTNETVPRFADLAETIELSTKAEPISLIGVDVNDSRYLPLDAYRFRESHQRNPFRRCCLSVANEAITSGSYPYIYVYVYICNNTHVYIMHIYVHK